MHASFTIDTCNVSIVWKILRTMLIVLKFNFLQIFLRWLHRRKSLCVKSGPYRQDMIWQQYQSHPRNFLCHNPCLQKRHRVVAADGLLFTDLCSQTTIFEQSAAGHRTTRPTYSRLGRQLLKTFSFFGGRVCNRCAVSSSALSRKKTLTYLLLTYLHLLTYSQT